MQGVSTLGARTPALNRERGAETPIGIARRAQIVQAIRGFTIVHGYAPTQRELSVLTGIPSSTVELHLGVLRRKGIITWQTGSPRTLRLTLEAAP
jgi:SOS-response transcriptional repressor LexA